MRIAACSCPDHQPVVHRRVHTFDMARAQRKQERAWKRAKSAEADYGRKLRAVAEQVGRLIHGIPPDDPPAEMSLQMALRKYSDLLAPWAQSVAARMLADVDRRDEQMWIAGAKDMGVALRAEIRTAPTGQLLKDMLAENVKLITSLPIEAGQRVHELVLKRLETSGRAKEIEAEIMRSGEVTKSRANLIAVTEVSRAASGLIEARAIHVGSEGYIWRSSEDSAVRNTDGNPVGSHRLLNGKFIKWKEPPVASTDGTRAHAGQIYRCRCWPEPVLPLAF